MILARDDGEQIKQLSADELAEVQNCWGCGVPLRTLARQHGIDEQELKFQIEKQRQLQALSERFGGRLDG